MYAKLEISIICNLKVIEINMTEKIYLPNEKNNASKNLHFLTWARQYYEAFL